PSDSASAQNTKSPAQSANPPAQSAKPKDGPKNGKDGQVVSIAPVTNPKPSITGRDGHSDPPKTAAPPPQNVPSAPNKGNFTIQVGSFKDQGEADTRASRLKSSVGGEVRVVKADIPGKGTWNRLQVGSFASREAAMSYGNQLRSKNVISDFIFTTK